MVRDNSRCKTTNYWSKSSLFQNYSDKEKCNPLLNSVIEMMMMIMMIDKDANKAEGENERGYLLKLMLVMFF